MMGSPALPDNEEGQPASASETIPLDRVAVGRAINRTYTSKRWRKHFGKASRWFFTDDWQYRHSLLALRVVPVALNDSRPYLVAREGNRTVVLGGKVVNVFRAAREIAASLR